MITLRNDFENDLCVFPLTLVFDKGEFTFCYQPDYFLIRNNFYESLKTIRNSSAGSGNNISMVLKLTAFRNLLLQFSKPRKHTAMN